LSRVIVKSYYWTPLESSLDSSLFRSEIEMAIRF
jgi:hypothetical protein